MKTSKLIYLFIGVLFYSGALAQNDFSTPRNALASYYGNMNKADGPNLSVASKIISSRHVFSKRKREQLAVDIMTYIEANGIVVRLDSVPGVANYQDSLTNESTFAIAPNLVLEKIGDQWYFSKETVNAIPEIVVETSEVDKAEEKSTGLLAERQQARLQRQKELEAIADMPVDLSTPYATVKFFIDNIEIDPAIASRIIANKDIHHLNERIEIAEKLDRFLKGKGVYVDIDQVPEDPDYTDSLHAGKYTYEISFRFSDIYLERDGGKWYLSKETAEKVPSLYEQAFPFGSDRLLKYIPTEGRIEFLGLYAWQYVAILILITLTYLIFRFLNWSITFIITRILFRFGYNELARTYIMPIVRPIGLLIAFMMAETALPFLQLPIKVNAFAAITVEILIPVFATIAFYYSADLVGLYLKKLAAKTENTFDDQIVPLVRKIIKTFVIVIGFVLVLQRMGTDIKILLGTLSVGGLALALAAQDTIKNFFGSLMIFLDKPFQAGHWVVTTDGIDGTVEEVGFRSTRIRTFENSLITVPNGKLSDASINNYGLRSYRRFKTYIAVTYDTPPDVLDLFVKGLREVVEQHPHTRKDFYNIYMNEMGSHSLNILFYIFFITPSWADELKYRHEIILSIMKLAEELGVSFAFPTQTLHMENFPGQESLSPQYKTPDELELRMKKFFAKESGGEGAKK
jgi:MscS family membrane protein